MLTQVTLLFNLVIRDRRILRWVLCSRPLVWVGKVSYSIYLLHYFILCALVSWCVPSKNYALSFVVFMGSVFVVAALSYRYIERPIQKITLKLPRIAFGSILRQRAGKTIRPVD